MIIRGIQFAAMIWLIFKDAERKGVELKYFTVWGAYSTLIYFGLAVVISL